MGKYTEKATASFFTALFITGTVTVPLASVKFYEAKFYELINIGAAIGVFAAAFAFVFLTSVKVDRPEYDRMMTLVWFTVYAVICSYQADNPWFPVGACAVLCGICVYCFSGGAFGGKLRLPRGLVYAVCGGAAVYLAVFVGVQTVMRYLTFSTPTYDFGIFSQMFYNMRRSFLPVTTLERETLLSHFAVHFSPIFYLWLPFYAVFPSPATLMICQAVTLASGVVPLCMICKRLGLSGKSRMIFSLVYVLYPALAGGTFFDVHENKFLAPLLLWLIYFIERESLVGTLGFTALTCLVKEDAPIYVVFLALFVLAAKKGKRAKMIGLAALGFAAVYFAAAVALMSKFGIGIMSDRFSNFTDADGGLVSVVINVFKNPARVIYEMFSPAASAGDTPKTVFILQTLVPLGFLPFIGKRIERLILALPYFLVNLMPDYVYQHNIFFQYTYGSFILLLYASVLNYRDLPRRAGRTIGAFAVCASLIFTSNTVYKRANYLSYYAEDGEKYAEMSRVLSEIPEEASVFATTFLCPALSEREELYDLNFSKEDHLTDYVAVDTRYSENEKFYVRYSMDERYEIVYDSEENGITVFRITGEKELGIRNCGVACGDAYKKAPSPAAKPWGGGAVAVGD